MAGLLLMKCVCVSVFSDKGRLFISEWTYFVKSENIFIASHLILILRSAKHLTNA